MFTRTTDGLSSEHLFYDVDWVVYCEGVSESEEVSSLDEVFWSKILRTLGINCRCKSFGSKTNLLDLAYKVENGEMGNVIVAMDRDFDHLNGKRIEHPQVIYTWGYSWESDACQEFSIRRAVQLFANILHCETIAAEYKSYCNSLSLELKRGFALDFKYHNHPQSLFDRKKPLSIVETTGGRGPCIRKRQLLKNARRLDKHCPIPLSSVDYKAASGFRDFFGKVVSKLIYHWFAKRTERLAGRRRVPYELFMLTLVESMDVSVSHEARNVYYQGKVAALV